MIIPTEFGMLINNFKAKKDILKFINKLNNAYNFLVIAKSDSPVTNLYAKLISAKFITGR